MTPRRVLIADGDRRLLASYREFLAGAGYEVEVAATGPECLAKLHSFGPDVLVLEPDLARDAGGATPPADALVLVLSARMNLDHLFQVGAWPVSAYYVKPIAPAELAECIRRLRRRAVFAGAGVPADVPAAPGAEVM